MKSFNNLYDKICSFKNLHAAFVNASKNKRGKEEVLNFSMNLEDNLITLQNELLYRTYQPSRYREFYIKEPKERLILALPFRDRVIHQAICAVIIPIFDSSFIYDSYACRKNKGTLAGVKRCSYFLNKEISRTDIVFCLKMDISKYFYSIRHHKLKELIRRKIRCRKTLDLLFDIIDSTEDPGIPVGNLTSQLFANIFLNPLDHFTKEELRIKHYLRYMDDMIILSNSKKKLWENFLEIKNFIEDVLLLKLNRKTSIFPVKKGIDFLGFRQYPNIRLLRKRVMIKNYKKFNKLKKLNDGEKIMRSLASLNGLCKHCSSKKVVININKIIGVN